MAVNSLEKLMYVATGEEWARTKMFRAFQRYMQRYASVTVVTKFDLGYEVAVVFDQDDDRYGKFSREEQAAAEFAIVHDAKFFMGWSAGTTFSWMQVMRARAVEGKVAFFLNLDCPGMKAVDYLVGMPFQKGYTQWFAPPRPTDNAEAQAIWDMHYDRRLRAKQFDEIAQEVQ